MRIVHRLLAESKRERISSVKIQFLASISRFALAGCVLSGVYLLMGSAAMQITPAPGQNLVYSQGTGFLFFGLVVGMVWISSGFGLPFLLVVSPETDNLHNLFLGDHLIDKAVLDVDSP